MRSIHKMAYGLDETYNYAEFYFDSLDTQQGNIGGISTRDWPLFLFTKPLNNVAAIKILEVQIPFTWYVFNSFNNTFTLTEAIGAPATVTIPIGNYSTTSLTPILQTALNTASPNGYTYTVTFSGASSSQPNTGKFTFTSSAGTQFIFQFAGSEGYIDPAIYLGFRGSVPFVSSAGGILVAPNVANVTGPNYLYIQSQKLGSLCDTYLPAGADKLGGGGTGTEIAKIPVNVQPGGVIYWQDPAPDMWFDLENIPNLADVDFFLSLGNNGIQTPLQLNGSSFSLKLGILKTKSLHNVTMHGTASQRRVVRQSFPR